MAGQTGQNGPALSLAARSRSGVVADLLDRPGSFAFAQAVEIASRVVRSQGLPAGRELCRFRVNPSLSFPPGDIEELRFAVLEDGSARVELTLNLMGLHGAASPLPAYFTEHVARHQ
ncbi:MAG: type VI secretion system baseplate subunit TssG, partial [Deltaproteobacteria bacterium]|nr:type VI secretion system baseplate subunit TssG [Deltaproteobacteria bacterium]